MKRTTLVLALAAAFVARDGAAVAQEAKPGGTTAKTELNPAEAYAARKSAVMTLVANKLEPPANFAFENDLKRTAVDVYRQILDFNTDNKKARERLGFDFKEGAWVANEAKQTKIEEFEDGAKGEKKRGEFEKKLRDSQKEGAKLLAEVGNLALAAGDEDAAKGHFKAAMEFDDQNAIANEKSGHKLVDGKWFSGRALAHKEWAKTYKATLAKAQALTVTPTTTEDSTKICETAGIPVKKYRTKNFRIESTLSDAEIRDTLVWLERARRFYLDLYNVEDRFLDYEASPLIFVVVGTDEQHDKLIDACALIPTEKKSFQKKFTLNMLGKITIDTATNGEAAQRNSIHSASHAMIHDTFGNPAPWLLEAMANSVSAAIKGAALTVCFSGDGSTGGIHLESISLEQAPGVIRDTIKAGKDKSLGDFVNLPPDQMDNHMIAKAWSIVMYLLESDPKQARDYYYACGQGGDGEKSKDDKVLKQFFPDFADWAALDTVWREWAVDVYKQ